MNLCLTTPAPSPERSVAFLTRLGFTPITEDSRLMTDGAALIDVDPESRARAGVRVWRGARDAAAGEALDLHGAVAFEGGHLVAAPSGTPVWVMDGSGPDLELAPRGEVLGNYAGVSLETPSLARSVAFWGGLLGLEVGAGGADQGWVTLRRPGMVDLSLMGPLACPHSFANPSFTYFNGGRNPEVLDAIRARGVEVFEEVGAKDGAPAENAILREPGGVGFFVFND